MSEWETVRTKRRGKGRRVPRVVVDACCVAHAAPKNEPEEDLAVPPDFAARHAARCAELAVHAWFRATLASLRARVAAVDVVACYGLGSVFSSRNAEWQLAFLALVADSYGARASAHDPILQCAEVTALGALGVAAAPPLDGSPRPPDADRVLYYMPHCPMTLYAAVLTRHAGHLDRAVIVGNSFRSYADRRLGRDLDPAIDATLAVLTEVPADPGRDDLLERPFNDTAIMLFDAPAAPGDP